MNKIRKSRYFKFIALLLVFLFIFQADTILSVQKGKTDHEKQFELAKKEVYNRQFDIAKKRLQRLVLLLNKKIKEEKGLLKKANALLKRIRRLQYVKTTNMIEKPAKRKKKRKLTWLWVVLGAVVVGAAVYFFVKSKKGTIRVTSTPTSADIWVDDSLRSQVTPASLKVKIGRRNVKVRKAGYRLEERDVSVRRNEQTEVHFDLTDIRYGTQLHIDGLSETGYVRGTWDPDWFWFYVKEPGTYMIDTYAYDYSDVTDNYMYLYGIDNRTNEIERDDDSGTSLYARISRELDPGNYFVKIRGYNDSYSGYYRIRVSSESSSASTSADNIRK